MYGDPAHLRGYQSKRNMAFSRSLWITPLMFVLLSGNLIAQEHNTPADTLDLAVLIKTVRENNPDLKASRLEADALALRRSQVHSLPDPKVGITYQTLSIIYRPWYTANPVAHRASYSVSRQT